MFTHIWNLLKPEYRERGIFVGIAAFCKTLLDFTGVAALIPILIVLFGDKPDKKLALMLCAGVLLFILIKNGIGLFITRYQTRFLLSLYKYFSYQLFRSYYHRGLLFLKGNNTSKLANEVNFVCYAFSLNVLQQILSLFCSSLLVFFMVLALLIWAPLAGALLCMGFVPLVFFYIRYIKQRARQYGKEEIEVRREQARTVIEAFRGFCELEINQAYPVLEKSFLQGLDRINECRMRMTMIGTAPSLISEASIVLGLALLILAGNGNLSIVSGVFAVAAFRMIPAMRSILGSWTSIRNYSYCLDILKDGLKDESTLPPTEVEPLSFCREITVEDLHFSYTQGNEILTGINLSIKKGERIGIKGYSGVGKSTLFHLMLGFFPPEKGRICIDGKELNGRNLSSWHRLIGYVPQEIFIMKGTLAQNIALGMEDISESRIWDVLEQVQLREWAETLPQGIHSSLGEFGSQISGGQKQRIGIARALYKRAEILFFDEATSSLDNKTEEEINHAIQNLSETHSELTIITIAHRESSLRSCHRIITL